MALNKYHVDGEYATEGPDGIENIFSECIEAENATAAIQKAKEKILKQYPNDTLRFWEFSAQPETFIIQQTSEKAFQDLLTKYPDAEMLWQSNQDGRLVMCSRAYTRKEIFSNGSTEYFDSTKCIDPITLLTSATYTQTCHYELKLVELPLELKGSK